MVVNDQYVEKRMPVQDWCKKFHDVWNQTDRLFSLLRSTDDYYRQPIQLRLPIIFYLGHLPCFSWLQFRNINKNSGESIDKLYDKIFERGVDPDVETDVETGVVKHSHSSQFSMDTKNEENYWRSFSVTSVNDYKRKVREKLINILTDYKLDLNDIETLNILNIALEHEMLHQETMMYMFVHLPIESLRLNMTCEDNFYLSSHVSSLSDNSWVLLPGGQTSLGKPYDVSIEKYSFGWDNEFPCESAYIPPFEMQSHPIRNGDFLQFVLNNGYMTSDWWDEKVFQWITTSDIHHPASWMFENGSYRVNFVLQRNIPIEKVLDHPVLVSQVEAKAYCRWLSNKTGERIDLPTEAEWVYAMWDWSDCLKTGAFAKDSNINFRHFHTRSVCSSVDNKQCLQWQGSAFEWTSSPFRPFENYRGSLPTYPGYSSDFFDNQHYVVLGASFATNSALVRQSFRNWYQDIYRYAFATFRCVKRIEQIDHSLTEIDRKAIISLLSNTDHRRITSEYLYDTYGSMIFSLITQMKEYYLFKQEFELLKRKSNDIKSTIVKHSKYSKDLSSTIHLIELGCGDGGKIQTFLKPWIQTRNDIPFVYHPVDISKCAIDLLVQLLGQTFGKEIIQEHVNPICSTFDEMYKRLQIDFQGIRVVMLMGSTIGNFSSFDSANVKYGNDAPAMKLLSSIRQNLQIGDWLVCSFDMCKNLKTLIRAYDDSKGITAGFNYNLLARLNRELNFNFDINNYRHHVTYNPLKREMESWLISLKSQTVTDHQEFNLKLQSYDAIQIELSTKYIYEDIQALMEKNSMHIIDCFWTEDEQLPYAICIAQMV